MLRKIIDCRLVVHNPQLYQKSETRVRPFCRSAESSNIFSDKCPWWRLFSIKVAGLDLSLQFRQKGSTVALFEL